MRKIISGLFFLVLVATANAESLPFSTVFKGRDKFDRDRGEGEGRELGGAAAGRADGDRRQGDGRDALQKLHAGDR